MLNFAWKDWERKASNFPPEVAFQLYSFHWAAMTWPATWRPLAHARCAWWRQRQKDQRSELFFLYLFCDHSIVREWTVGPLSSVTCVYVYAVYWLPPASPGFPLARKCEMRGHTKFNGVALLSIPLLWLYYSCRFHGRS